MNKSTNRQALKDFIRPNRYELKEYVIQDGQKHPFAILCPGGGYDIICSFNEGIPFAEKLNEMGYSAFVLYYHCKKKARFPAPQDDLARTVSEIIARSDELNLDTNSYSIWGASAGGHLAATFGTDTMGYKKYQLPKPSVLILSYPVVSMSDLTHKRTRKNLIGDTPEQELIDLTSVEKQVTDQYPPTFIWCGDSDKTVSPENSKMLASALNDQGVPNRIMVYPGIDHGVGLGTGTACESWFMNAIQFWQEHMQ